MTDGTRSRRRGNGEGSVYFDKSKGLYRGAVTLPDGTRRRVSGPSRRECARRMAELAGNLATGVGVGGTDLVGPYLKWWLGIQEAKVGTADGDMSVNTLENKRWALAGVIAAHGGRRLRDLEPEHVETVLNRMAAAGKSRSAVLRVRATLSQALDTAVRRGKVVRNVSRLAEMPRTAPPVEKRALTADQAADLLRAAAGTDVEAFVVTGLGLGLRPGELLGLRWANIDLKAGTLTVAGSLKREGNQSRLGDVKRGIRASRRTLSLPAPVVDALRSHKAAQAARRLELGPEVWSNPDDLVFTTEVGTPVDKSNMNRRLAKVTEAAGLGRWSMTELARHSAASLLSDAGVPLEQIADTLGHSSTRMLERHYRHQVRPTIDGHVGTMDRVLGGAK